MLMGRKFPFLALLNRIEKKSLRPQKSNKNAFIFAFGEGERILIELFLRKSLSRVLWTSHKGIDRDTTPDFRHWAPF